MDYKQRLLTIAVVLTAFGSIHTSQSANIYLERGSKGVVPCSSSVKFNRCFWKKDGIEFIETGKLSQRGYTINLQPNTCNLIIASVRANDTGTWTCGIPGIPIQDVHVTAGVQPTKNFFLYNNHLIESNEYNKYIIEPDAKGQIEVQCVSENVFPAPNITWKVDDVYQKGNSVDIPSNNPKTYKNIITLQYPVLGIDNHNNGKSKWEKRVYCEIQHQGYKNKKATIYATFVQEHPVTEVHFQQQSTGHGTMLICNADGYPTPKYEIQKIHPDTKKPIGEPVKTKSHTVTENGVYQCTASNTVGSSTPVNSEPLTVSTYINNSGLILKPFGSSLLLFFMSLVFCLLRLFH